MTSATTDLMFSPHARLLVASSFVALSVFSVPLWLQLLKTLTTETQRAQRRPQTRDQDWKSATSTLSPGPKPRATHGPSAPLSISRFRMKSTVADDMLPYSDSTSREAQTASADRPSAPAAES